MTPDPVAPREQQRGPTGVRVDTGRLQVVATNTRGTYPKWVAALARDYLCLLAERTRQAAMLEAAGAMVATRDASVIRLRAELEAANRVVEAARRYVNADCTDAASEDEYQEAWRDLCTALDALAAAPVEEPEQP